MGGLTSNITVVENTDNSVDCDLVINFTLPFSLYGSLTVFDTSFRIENSTNDEVLSNVESFVQELQRHFGFIQNGLNGSSLEKLVPNNNDELGDYLSKSHISSNYISQVFICEDVEYYEDIWKYYYRYGYVLEQVITHNLHICIYDKGLRFYCDNSLIPDDLEVLGTINTQMVDIGYVITKVRKITDCCLLSCCEPYEYKLIE